MPTRSVREQAATVVAAWDGAVGRPGKAAASYEDETDRIDVATRLSWVGTEVELLRRALAADHLGNPAARIADVIRDHAVDAASGRCACGGALFDTRRDAADLTARWSAHVADAIIATLGVGEEPSSLLTGRPGRRAH